jgi:SHS2 domain-containing protein
MHASYDYFEHGADMGIVGRGDRIEEAFEQAAAAMFAIMADPGQIRPETTVAIEFEESDAELALVTWLNLLLGEARSRALILGRFRLHRGGASPKGTFPSSGIETCGTHWSGTAEGEPWRSDLERGVEVKGATLTQLAVKQQDGIWEARCVVDV